MTHKKRQPIKISIGNNGKISNRQKWSTKNNNRFNESAVAGVVVLNPYTDKKVRFMHIHEIYYIDTQRDGKKMNKPRC